MRQWMTQLSPEVARNGVAYRAQVIGTERPDGTWEGRLAFRTAGEAEPVVTDEETSQPSRDAIEYWATGLEAIYLEGALQRAIDRTLKRRSA